jgi:hypothetical protein
MMLFFGMSRPEKLFDKPLILQYIHNATEGGGSELKPEGRWPRITSATDPGSADAGPGELFFG